MSCLFLKKSWLTLGAWGEIKQSLFCYSSEKKNHEHVLLSFYEFFSTLEDKYVGVLSPDLQTSQAFWNNC